MSSLRITSVFLESGLELAVNGNVLVMLFRFSISVLEVNRFMIVGRDIDDQKAGGGRRRRALGLTGYCYEGIEMS